jgi:hypothetical protein
MNIEYVQIFNMNTKYTLLIASYTSAIHVHRAEMTGELEISRPRQTIRCVHCYLFTRAFYCLAATETTLSAGVVMLKESTINY